MTGRDQSEVPAVLLHILQQVCLDGKDAFIQALDSKTFKVARLVSKMLRDIVDGSLLQIVINVTPLHKGLVAHGHRSPLWRWHRLRELTISVGPEKFDEGGVEVTTLFTLPFLGQPLESLQQIERLRLCAENDQPLPTAGLGWLFYRLPNLRYILFATILSSDATQQLLFYNALASLSRLECLSLPSLFLLQRIGPLADRLREVEFCDVCNRPDHEALLETDWLVPAVSQLRELRRLKVRFYRGGIFGVAGIVELLHNLPTGVEHVQIALDMLEDPEDPELGMDHTVKLTFEARRIVSVELPLPLFLDRFATFVCAILLPCYRLSPVLPLLRLGGIRLRSGLLSEQQLQQLRELAGRCWRLEVETLFLGEEKVDSELFLNTIEVLGMPQKVYFMDDISCCRLLGPVSQPTASAVAGVFHTDTAAASALPKLQGDLSQRAEQEAFLAERVMQRLAAAAAASKFTSPAPPAADAITVPSTSSRIASNVLHLVVVQSPFLRVLAWSKDALTAWMRHLAKQVAAAQSPLADGAGGQPRDSAMAYYVVVPSSATVLVECSSAEAAAVVEEVARLALDVSGVDSTTAASLQVYTLPAKPLHYWGTASWLWQEMLRVVQEFWDSGAGGSEPERLRRLLDLGYLAAEGSIVMDFSDQVSEGGTDPRDVDQEQE